MDIPTIKFIDIILSLMIFVFCFFCVWDFSKKCRLISDANKYPVYPVKVRTENNQVRHKVGFLEIGFVGSFLVFNIFNILIWIIVYFLSPDLLSDIKGFPTILSFDGTFLSIIYIILLAVFITDVINVYKNRHATEAIGLRRYIFLQICTGINSVIITFVSAVFLFNITLVLERVLSGFLISGYNITFFHFIFISIVFLLQKLMFHCMVKTTEQLVKQINYKEHAKKIKAELKMHQALQKKSDEIMQHVAHQVKSPLTGLTTLCNELISYLSEISVPDSEEDKKKKKIYTARILKSQTNHVINIVSNYQNFLDFGSGKYPHLKLKKIELYSFLIDIASTYQAYANEQGLLDIKVENKGITTDKTQINGDENLLMNIFSCIIDNAIKYSLKNNSVYIEIMKKEKEYLTVKIKNKSIIPILPDIKEKIFERNYRTNEAKAIFEQGTGIGLYLVKEICKFIRGDCYAEDSQENADTIIAVKIPVYFKTERRV